jgi:hypothetical protein
MISDCTRLMNPAPKAARYLSRAARIAPVRFLASETICWVVFLPPNVRLAATWIGAGTATAVPEFAIAVL